MDTRLAGQAVSIPNLKVGHRLFRGKSQKRENEKANRAGLIFMNNNYG